MLQFANSYLSPGAVVPTGLTPAAAIVIALPLQDGQGLVSAAVGVCSPALGIATPHVSPLHALATRVVALYVGVGAGMGMRVYRMSTYTHTINSVSILRVYVLHKHRICILSVYCM